MFQEYNEQQRGAGPELDSFDPDWVKPPQECIPLAGLIEDSEVRGVLLAGPNQGFAGGWQPSLNHT